MSGREEFEKWYANNFDRRPTEVGYETDICWQAWQAAREQEGDYPPCDTCKQPLDYMPWHYSEGDNRHLHACDECWDKRQSQGVPDDLRAKGLSVAVHNDYRLNGDAYTFWLFTDSEGMSYKGEGRTDADALNAVRALLSTPAAPQADEIEPDLLWDYDNGEDSGQDSAYELADYCAQDLPHGETMEVVVMCAKRLPNRHMKIWVDEDDDVQWEWISPQPPEQGDGV